MSLPPPLLAAGFEGLVAVAFLVISVIGWVINQAGGQNNPGAKPGAVPRPQPKRKQVQNEIDQFLQQATGQRPARGNVGMIADEDVEIIEEGPRRVPVAPERRPPAQPQRPQPQRPQPQAQRPQPARPQPQAQPRPQPAQAPVRTPAPAVTPRVTSSTLGMGVRQHVSVHMVDQISQHVAQDIPRLVGSMAQQPLSDSSTAQSWSATPSTAADIGAELRNLDAIRRAMIINEILSPPLSRRTRAG